MNGAYLGLTEEDWASMLDYPTPSLIRCCPMMEDLRSQIRMVYALGVGQYSAELVIQAYDVCCKYHDMNYSLPLTHLIHHLKYNVLEETQHDPILYIPSEAWL